MPAATAALDAPAPAPMELLQHGIPLSLLLDLVLGPHSEDLLREEPTRRLLPSQPYPAAGPTGAVRPVSGR